MKMGLGLSHGMGIYYDFAKGEKHLNDALVHPLDCLKKDLHTWIRIQITAYLSYEEEERKE